MPPKTAQIIKGTYEYYLLERSKRQDARGEPLAEEAFKHYMETLTHIYATAHDFEAALRQQIEKDEHEKMLREAARKFAKK